MNLGKAIKSLRVEFKLTQAEFANLVEISPTSLSQIELGKKEPSKKTLAKISQHFNIPIGLIYLLGIDIDDVPENKKALYDVLYPSIKELSLNLVSSK